MRSQEEVIAAMVDRMGDRNRLAVAVGVGYSTVQGWEGKVGKTHEPGGQHVARLCLLVPDLAPDLLEALAGDWEEPQGLRPAAPQGEEGDGPPLSGILRDRRRDKRRSG